MRQRLAELVPVTAGLGPAPLWAATIDYTPDHLPIIGPAITAGQAIGGATVASAGGAGMMWARRGPGRRRRRADRPLTAVDVTELGLDRFDAAGNSRLGTDPIALPFPQHAPQAPGKLTVSDNRCGHLSQRGASIPDHLPRKEDRHHDRRDSLPGHGRGRRARGLGPAGGGDRRAHEDQRADLWKDGDQEVGVWECTPGPSYWKLETHEFVTSCLAG